MSVNDRLAVARGIVLLGLGGAGMVNEMFVQPQLHMGRVALYVAMILGEGALSTLWLAGRSSGDGQPSQQPPSSSSGSTS